MPRESIYRVANISGRGGVPRRHVRIGPQKILHPGPRSRALRNARHVAYLTETQVQEYGLRDLAALGVLEIVSNQDLAAKLRRTPAAVRMQEEQERRAQEERERFEKQAAVQQHALRARVAATVGEEATKKLEDFGHDLVESMSTAIEGVSRAAAKAVEPKGPAVVIPLHRPEPEEAERVLEIRDATPSPESRVVFSLDPSPAGLEPKTEEAPSVPETEPGASAPVEAAPQKPRGRGVKKQKPKSKPKRQKSSSKVPATSPSLRELLRKARAEKGDG